MFKKEVMVRCESGLHNRQATYFVQKANEFDCSIWIEVEMQKACWALCLWAWSPAFLWNYPQRVTTPKLQ